MGELLALAAEAAGGRHHLVAVQQPVRLVPCTLLLVLAATLAAITATLALVEAFAATRTAARHILDLLCVLPPDIVHRASRRVQPALGVARWGRMSPKVPACPVGLDVPDPLSRTKQGGRDAGRVQQGIHRRAEGRVRVTDFIDFEWVVWRLEVEDPS